MQGECQCLWTTKQLERLLFWPGSRLNLKSLKKRKIEFNNILEWVEKLGEVNTDNVEPLVSVNDEALTLRQDNITAGQMSEQILKNAPAQEFGYFVVPKVVE